MRINLLIAFVFVVVLLVAGTVLAAPVQGLLVDKMGLPLAGYSNVYIVNGQALPVYDSNTNRWYHVFIIGTGENGVPLCVLGKPMGFTPDTSTEGNGNRPHIEFDGKDG
jgi:hypothetical protein